MDIREREQFLKLNEGLLLKIFVFIFIAFKTNKLNSYKENKLLFGQLPLIEYDGKLMTQSRAASRYFAKKGNLLGSNDDEELR